MSGVRSVGRGVEAAGHDSPSAGLAGQRPAVEAAHARRRVDLVLLLLADVLRVTGWAYSVAVPNVFHIPYTGGTLSDPLVCDRIVDQPLLFCIGVVLLFSKERGRPRYRLDWTRRWGVICSYVTFVLSAAQILFITALVMVGITALFLSMPRRFQPAFPGFLGKVSRAYLRQVSEPKLTLYLVAFSSVALLLACVPLFNALRSSGSKRFAAVLVAPLALFSLVQLAQAGLYCVGFLGASVFDYYDGSYFRPYVLVDGISALVVGRHVSEWDLIASVVEAAKWCTILAIAVWLSVAQVAAHRQGKKANTA